jgi:hypothetical protein
MVMFWSTRFMISNPLRAGIAGEPWAGAAGAVAAGAAELCADAGRAIAAATSIAARTRSDLGYIRAFITHTPLIVLILVIPLMPRS